MYLEGQFKPGGESLPERWNCPPTSFIKICTWILLLYNLLLQGMVQLNVTKIHSS